MIGREKSETEDKEVSNTGVSTLEMRMCTLIKTEKFRSKFSFTYYIGGGAVGKESSCQCRRQWFDPWSGKIPWKREWQPTLVFLPGKFYGQGSPAGYSPWSHKESDMTGQVPLAKKQMT